MKAFHIQDRNEDHGLIVFSKHRASAQNDGANELNLEFSEVSCKRKKEYDEFYPTVPISKLLEDGWWWTCGCGEPRWEGDIVKINEDNEAVYCKKCTKK